MSSSRMNVPAELKDPYVTGGRIRAGHVDARVCLVSPDRRTTETRTIKESDEPDPRLRRDMALATFPRPSSIAAQSEGLQTAEVARLED